MELVKHIRDLLYHHDCVVVPGFGGFVTNERSARIDKASDSFYPPAREVGFNARLDHNDGLLISYLSARLSMNYVDVRKMTEAFTQEVNRKLREGKEVHFEGIGRFIVDRRKNLQFDPDPSANFFTDAYGLTFFRYPALETVEPVRRMQKRLREKEPAGFSRTAKKMLRYAAIGIPLAAALGWGAMHTGLIREFSFDLSSLNPFTAVVDSGIRAVPADPEQDEFSDSPVEGALERMSNQRQALIYEEAVEAEIPAGNTGTGTEPAAGGIAGYRPAPGESIPGPVEEALSARRHYIVAGSFRSIRNANIYREQLETEGYRSEVIESERGLYWVSLYSTHNSGEALQMLRQVRLMSGRTDAWMLSR